MLYSIRSNANFRYKYSNLMYRLDKYFKYNNDDFDDEQNTTLVKG